MLLSRSAGNEYTQAFSCESRRIPTSPSRHPWTHVVSGMIWGDSHIVVHGPCSSNPKEGLVHGDQITPIILWSLPFGFADSGIEDAVQKERESLVSQTVDLTL